MFKNFKLIAAAIGLAGLPFGAQAALVTYDFTVTATSGSLAEDTASGSMSFDDSLLSVPNTNHSQPGLLSDLAFTWKGTTFDASTANTGQISSGTAGQLLAVGFGDNCSNGGCTTSVADPNDWFVAYSFADHTGRFAYADSAGSYVSSDVTFTPVPTPLPASGWLLLSAIALTAVFLPKVKTMATAVS